MLDKNYKILEKEQQNILSLEEVKSYLRISHSADDDLLDSMILAAISFAEEFLGYHFIHKELEAKFQNIGKVFPLEKPILEIKKVFIDDKELSSEEYILRDNKIIFYEKYSDVKIIYSVGINDVSPNLKEALKNHINLLYEKRGDPNLFSYQAKGFYRDFGCIKI